MIKYPDKSKLVRNRFVGAHDSSYGPLWHGIDRKGTEGAWSYRICTVEAEREEGWYSNVLLYRQLRIQAEGMVPPRVGRSSYLR